MNPYLVDVPVRVNIWIRPECQQKQFEVLKQARPSILFLISDGGRNEKEWQAIRENRALIDNGIDWECEVYRIYEEKNNGLYAMSKKGTDLIWSKVDRCVFLEDDYVPSVSYFQFCAEMLEKYKYEQRVEAVCGMNHCGTWERASSDYFFSTQGSIWGMATWKRVFEERDYNFSFSNDKYVMNLLNKKIEGNHKMRDAIKTFAKKTKKQRHVAGGEFFYSFDIYGKNRLFIIPRKNLINNIGCTSNGAHAEEYRLLPRGIRRIFNMRTYELAFPLKHPICMIDDMEYSKKTMRIMAVGHPVVQLWRRIESAFLAIRHKGIKGIADRFSKMLKRTKTIEK